MVCILEISRVKQCKDLRRVEMTFHFTKGACRLDPKSSLSSLWKNVIGNKGVEGLGLNSTLVGKYNAVIQHTIFAYDEHHRHVCGGEYSWWYCDFCVKPMGSPWIHGIGEAVLVARLLKDCRFR